MNGRDTKPREPPILQMGEDVRNEKPLTEERLVEILNSRKMENKARWREARPVFWGTFYFVVFTILAAAAVSMISPLPYPQNGDFVIVVGSLILGGLSAGYALGYSDHINKTRKVK